MNSQQQETSEVPILELRQVSKHFRGVKALTQVDFDLQAGEVHGVVGGKVADKSTLMKILSGMYSDYEGQMLLYGKPVRFHSPANARAQGIGMVHQELTIFPDLTIAENIFNGNQPMTHLGRVNWKAMKQQAQGHLQEFGLSLDVTSLMSSVSVGTQKMVEIARVIFSGAQIVILDEPTSSLSLLEVRHLFTFIEWLKEQGKSIIFISHFLEDVLQITDRVSVFKNGQRVATHQTSGLTKRDIVSLMLGTESHILLPAYEEKTARSRRATTEEGKVVLEAIRG